jgi:hypothetical protein
MIPLRRSPREFETRAVVLDFGRARIDYGCGRGGTIDFAVSLPKLISINLLLTILLR